MKNLFLILLLASCSSAKFENLAQNSRYNRMGIKQTSYTKPDFFIPSNIQNLSVTKISSRSIASVVENAPNYTSLSNKEVYFLALYEQYNAFRNYTLKNDSVQSCPAFHQTLIKQERAKKLSSKSSDLKINRDKAIYNPVLALPYEGVDLFSYFNSKGWNQSQDHVQNALSDFSENQFKEIKQLCETGSSDQYFVFENLISYHQTNTDFGKNRESLAALLKVPVFANLLILDNIDRNAYDKGYTAFTNEAMGRVNSLWLKDYLKQLANSRQENLAEYKR